MVVVELQGAALKMLELSSMMQLILASALRISAGKGSPGVPTRHVPLNCMTSNVKAYFLS